MNKKTIIIYVSILIMALFSFSAVAEQSHLDEAIQHAEAAVTSADGKTLAKHAQEAKTHAKAAKNDKTDAKHVDEGIKCLDSAIKAGNDGNLDVAKKEATDAVNHFKQAAK
ncbi:small metal-binding protein SmbP [Nitrosomonas sp.]|uniref:small metal-binding protein SmbP n=1 Tax=Nitrosomonas sp. TaxID=42353 RepID=UPI00374CABC7